MTPRLEQPQHLPNDAIISRAIERRRAATENLLARYVGTETPTGDTDAINDFAAHLVERYTELGCTATLVESPGGSHLIAELPGRGRLAAARPVILLGHLDTVWPRGTLENMPATTDGITFRGPGALDMKSGLVEIETALAVLAETDTGHAPARILLASDEEIGSPNFSPVLAEHLAGAQCALGFEAPHPDGALKLGRRGSTRLRLSVLGRESHAALDPEHGISAIDELLDQLLAVRAIVTNADTDDSPVLCNVGTVSGGSRANVVSGQAEAIIGFRFVDATAERAVLDALNRLRPLREGAIVTVEVLTQRPAWGDRAPSEKLLAIVAAAGVRLGQTVEARPAAGAADTNLTGALGIPTLDGFGPRGGGAHAATEHAILESVHERIALLCATLSDEALSAGV